MDQPNQRRGQCQRFGRHNGPDCWFQIEQVHLGSEAVMEHAAIPGATLWVFPDNAEWPPVQVLEVEVSEMWEDGKELCVEREVIRGEVVGLQECTQVGCIGKGIKVNVKGDRVWESRSVYEQCAKVVEWGETI